MGKIKDSQHFILKFNATTINPSSSNLHWISIFGNPDFPLFAVKIHAHANSTFCVPFLRKKVLVDTLCNELYQVCVHSLDTPIAGEFLFSLATTCSSNVNYRFYTHLWVRSRASMLPNINNWLFHVGKGTQKFTFKTVLFQKASAIMFQKFIDFNELVSFHFSSDPCSEFLINLASWHARCFPLSRLVREGARPLRIYMCTLWVWFINHDGTNAPNNLHDPACVIAVPFPKDLPSSIVLTHSLEILSQPWVCLNRPNYYDNNSITSTRPKQHLALIVLRYLFSLMCPLIVHSHTALL